tara:strand:+ start:351 stop:692 length:342 start_codon:yes stop_codon:yes gene_type:complete
MVKQVGVHTLTGKYLLRNINMTNMRDTLIRALLAHAQGDIQKHVANVEVYLQNPAGIGEHSDITEAIETELNIIAKYQDQVDVINKYFKQKPTGGVGAPADYSQYKSQEYRPE